MKSVENRWKSLKNRWFKLILSIKIRNNVLGEVEVRLLRDLFCVRLIENNQKKYWELII